MSVAKLDLYRPRKADLNPQILDRIVGSLLLAGEFWWLLVNDNDRAVGAEWAVVFFVLGAVMVVAALGMIRSREWALGLCFKFYVLSTLFGVAGLIASDETLVLRLLAPAVPAVISGYCFWRLKSGDFG